MTCGRAIVICIGITMIFVGIAIAVADYPPAVFVVGGVCATLNCAVVNDAR